VLALSEGPDYQARAYVIQVPGALGTERGVELAWSDWVLREAILLSGVKRLDSGELRRRSKAESTSRLDIALTVEADRPQEAIRLAPAYAKAVMRAIPDDEGLPTRGKGARRAEGGLGPFRWPLFGALRAYRGRSARDRKRWAQARISASTSSRFSSMCSRETSDSRLRRRSGSVFEARTLKCHSS
jgi:hypothetical protein